MNRRFVGFLFQRFWLISIADTQQIAKKPKKELPKIFDGKYFVVEATNDNTGNIEARCTMCNEAKKGNISSTGNFLSHYKKKHEHELKDVQQYLKDGKLHSQTSKQPAITEVINPVTDSVV